MLLRQAQQLRQQLEQAGSLVSAAVRSSLTASAEDALLMDRLASASLASSSQSHSIALLAIHSQPSQLPANSRSAWSLPWLSTYRCMASMPYSKQVGRPRPKPWPVIDPVPSEGGKLRWQRTVIRVPPGVEVQHQGSSLLLSGRAGNIRLDLSQLDPTGVMAFRLLTIPASPPATKEPRSVVLLASPDEERFQALVSQVESGIQGVMQGYLVGLTVKGVGYRIEPVEEAVVKQTRYFELVSVKTNINYPYNKPANALRLRVGLPKPVIYPLPPDIRAFCVRPTLTYLYGLQLDRLQQIASDIRAVRKPSVYTGNGIQLLGEVLRQKQRSGRKAK